MTPQVRVDADADAPSESMLVCWLVYSILLNIPINCQASIHPMALLPAFVSSNIADLLSKPLPTISHHRYTQLVIGENPTPSTTSVARPTTTVVTSTVDSVTTASAAVDSVPTATPVSDSVPTLHPNLALAPTLPIVLDTGASFSRTPFASDFLPVAQAPYGLIRSPTSVVSNSQVNSVFSVKVSSPVDPYTLITGEDPTFDLSSLDPTVNSDSVYFYIREFGTSALTFIYSKSTSELLHIFVEPTQIDWLHWVPLPRLILPESYFHIFVLDYLQAFTLFHLIPIWIYYLLHFAVNLED